MGWTIPYDMPHRADLIKERTGGRRMKDSRPGYERKCLAHCYRGGKFSGVLWTVWEITDPDKGTIRYIGCDLLRYYSMNKSWGYKDLTESCFPSYSTCPLSYLNMVPEVASADWRAKVVQCWEDKRKAGRLLKGLVPGDRIFLKEGWRPRELIVYEANPLRAVNVEGGSGLYKIARRAVERVERTIAPSGAH